MTVSKLSKTKIKISLSDKEVMLYFGGYENIISGSYRTKIALAMLIKDSLNCDLADDSSTLNIEIKSLISGGCEILLSQHGEKTREKKQKIVAVFDDSEKMLDAAVHIYKTYRSAGAASSLYRISGKYALVITVYDTQKMCSFIREFSDCDSLSELDIEFVKEHGVLLAENDAISVIGRAFIRDF